MFTALVTVSSFVALVAEAGHHGGGKNWNWGWKSWGNKKDGNGWGGKKDWGNGDMKSQDTPVHQVLKGAINRGVPMYNDGQHKACAMIYETALHALVVGEGWGLIAEHHDMLEDGLAEGLEMDSMSDRAWHYRGLMDAVIANHKDGHMDEMATVAPEPEKTKKKKMTLFDFKSENAADDWDIVLDGVMGGLSTGFIDARNGKMMFYGATRLENNGGFSSIRADIAPGSLAGMNMLRIKVRGDGRTYILSAKGGNGNYSYWSRFETKKGKWMTFDIAIKDMEKHWFGMPRSGSIDPEDVRELELYIYDKQAGPFKLRVDYIKAMA